MTSKEICEFRNATLDWKRKMETTQDVAKRQDCLFCGCSSRTADTVIGIIDQLLDRINELEREHLGGIITW